MAGFQLTLYGRIWVTPKGNPFGAEEAELCSKAKTRSGGIER
jgi:hypothetical protein